MNIIKLLGKNLAEDAKIILESNGNGVVFSYLGQDKLCKYIDSLELNSSQKCKLRIFKDIDLVATKLYSEFSSNQYFTLLELLKNIDENRKYEIVVTGALKGKEEAKQARVRVSDIIQQLIYLNISLSDVQVMTDKEHIDNMRIKRFLDSLEKHEEAVKSSKQKLLNLNGNKDVMEILASLEKIDCYLKEVKENEFTIVTAASKKSGKSTVVNCMIKNELAPTSLELATPNNCIYKKSNRSRYTLEFEGKHKEFESDFEIRKYIGDIFKQNNKFVPDMEIGYIERNNEFSSYTIYDTPGPDLSGAEEHRKAAYRAIEDADVVVFSIDYSKYLTETETEYLKDIISSFNKEDKFYSLIINVNKLDARYSTNEDKNTVRILDFIRNKLIEIDDKFRTSIIIGTSALTYFNCLEFEKLERSLNLSLDNTFDEKLNELIDLLQNQTDDAKLTEIVFIGNYIRSVRTFEKKDMSDVNRVKEHSGMPNLLRYINYISEGKARNEKINNLLNKIDNEYTNIKNKFSFQDIERQIIENKSELETARKILTDFSEQVKTIYNADLSDANLLYNQNKFKSNSMGAMGQKRKFEINKIYENCKSEYIEVDLAPNNIIESVVSGSLKQKVIDDVNKLFAESTSKKYVNKEEKIVVKEQDIINKVKESCADCDDLVELNIKETLKNNFNLLREETFKIKEDLTLLLNERLKKLKEAAEFCRKKMKSDCNLDFNLITTDFAYAFRDDISQLDKIEIKIDITNLREDIGTKIEKYNKEKGVKFDFLSEIINKYLGRVVNLSYNEIAYNKDFIAVIYDDSLKGEIKKYLDKIHIEDSYAEQKKELEDSLKNFTDYIIKEFEYQTSNAYSYCDSVKKTLDNTDNYANKMEELNQRREELEEAKNNTNIIFGIWDGIKNVN